MIGVMLPNLPTGKALTVSLPELVTKFYSLQESSR